MSKNGIIFFSICGGIAGNLPLIGQNLGLTEHITAFVFAFFLTSISLDFTSFLKRRASQRRQESYMLEDV